MSKIVHVHVVEQMPHPMAGPAPFVVVQFDNMDFRLMDRRRIKREQAKAVRAWRKSRRKRCAI
jgi:hypothetical protein